MKQKIRVPNYLYQLLHEINELPAGTIANIDVRHDDNCAHWQGRPCDCNPDVQVMALDAVTKH